MIASAGRHLLGMGLVLAWALGAASPAHANTPALTALAEPERLRLVQRWAERVATRHLAIPEAPALDADVRIHAQALRQQAQKVLEDLGLAWTAPAAGQPGPEEDRAYGLLLHGTLAALARLHLGRHDPERATPWLPLLAAPRLCNQPGRAPGWAWHLQMLQQLPAAEREAAFAADLRGLAAMADPAWQPPPRPSPSLVEQLPGWLAEQRAGRDDGRSLGMAPAVGHTLFRDAEPDMSFWISRCLIAQWWAREEAQRGRVDAAGALLIFRYATLLQPQDWLGESLGGTDGYPPLAQRFAVEADITVEWGRDALGRTTDHRVVARKLKVPDGPPEAWLAWDDHFDRHALAAARARPAVKPVAGADGGAAQRQRATFNFNLQ